MPTTNEETEDFTAASYENLGGGKVMIVDQGSGEGLKVAPSRFKNFDVTRTSNIIGEITNLQFTFTTYTGQENELLVIRVPISSGLLHQSSCLHRNVTVPC